MQCEELRRTQLELESSRAVYQKLYDEAPVGYLTCTPPGKIVKANRTLATLLGCSLQELLGASFPRFAAPSHRDTFHHHTSGLRPGEVRSCEIGLIKVNGEARYVRLDSRLQRTEEGEVQINICAIDITEHRAAEARLREERRRSEAEQQSISKLEAIGVLAGGIAHDFNNLLTRVLFTVGLVQEDPVKNGPLLTEAEKATRQAAALTNQLLTFAKGGAPVKQPTSLAKVIAETARFCLRGSNVQLELALPDDLWPVEGDEGQLGQVIQNLVINADDAMGDGGVVRIDGCNLTVGEQEVPTLQAGRYVYVTVSDHGQGIAESDLPMIFDPYFTTKDHSGLGLTTVFSVIRSHGGRVTVSSAVAEGTTFQLYLPASANPPPEAEPASEPSAPEEARILAMDDDEGLRDLYRARFSQSAYEIDVVKDGRAAVLAYGEALTAGRPYDLVILDLTVPGGMGGAATLAELKALDPQVRALVASGYSVDPVMSDPARYGFSGTLKKPFDSRQLMKTIAFSLKEPRGRA